MLPTPEQCPACRAETIVTPSTSYHESWRAAQYRCGAPPPTALLEKAGHDADAAHHHGRAATPRRDAELAAAGPIYRITLPAGEPVWLITSYDQARHALHDSRLIKSPVTSTHYGRDLVPRATMLTGMVAGRDALAAAITALVSYLRGLIAAKRGNPADDLLSALMAARDGQDQLSDDELTSMAFLILVAGTRPRST